MTHVIAPPGGLRDSFRHLDQNKQFQNVIIDISCMGSQKGARYRHSEGLNTPLGGHCLFFSPLKKRGAKGSKLELTRVKMGLLYFRKKNFRIR